LIQQGANLNNQDMYGWTALMYIAYNALFEDRYPGLPKNYCKDIFLLFLHASANPYMHSYTEKAVTENYHQIYPHFSEDQIQEQLHGKYASKKYFNKTVFDINPELIKDLEVQKALTDYDERQRKQKQLLEMHIIPVLADIVEEYAGVPMAPETMLNLA
jgi:hypothetical protein